AEVCAREAKTIHRLLEPVSSNKDGKLTFRFNRHEGNQLEYDLVIVDEVSMVDTPLMASLFRAIGPKTSVVLVGDHNQLPPVGPGAVLRDLVFDPVCPVTVLTEVVRQAGELERNTSAILDGVALQTASRVSNNVELHPWYVIPVQNDQLPAFLVQAMRDLIPHRTIGECGIDPLWDIQILTPQHNGETGTKALNRALQELRQQQLGNPPPPAPKKPTDASRPLVGDKVIWTKNDYDLDLMNGTIGLVLAKRGSAETPYRQLSTACEHCDPPWA
ncbi:hypothetical protein LCGC14_1580710, partial [marine sediment metagenome]